MPRILSESDVADFRERLCEAAERLFAAKGLDGVTMRQLASELGVSPMTPYRYFRDKNEILAAVRANGYLRLAEVLEEAHTPGRSARSRGRSVAEAYFKFAFEHPDTYKLMFDFDQPDEEAYPELTAAAKAADAKMSSWVRELAASGELVGEPEQISRMFWAAAHGAIVLEMAGRLPKGGAYELQRMIAPALARGLRSETPPVSG